MGVNKRGTRWAARVYDPAVKGHQRWLGTYLTRDEAQEAFDRETAQTAPASRARTVTDWAAIWLRDYDRPAPATRRTYAYAVKAINRDAGDLRLSQVDRPAARRLAKAWPVTVTRVARTMFGDAHRDGLITANPFTGLRLETPKGRKDLDALTEPEITTLADTALQALGEYGPEFRAVLLFLGYVGCRPGELCCIRRDDLNTRHGEITIRYALDGQGGEKPPKNDKPRTITVPPPALAALAGITTRRLGSPYLFHTRTGRRLTKGSLHYAFTAVRQHAGRPDLDLYELRHAAATLLVERGLPPHVVAHQLGHTDGGALVQRLYGHPQDKGMRDQVHLAFAGWTNGQASMRATTRKAI